MISFDHAVKIYQTSGQRRVILNDFTYTLPRRNIAIMGGNGAGKSTLLRMIAGAEPLTRGSIRRQGRVSWPLGFQGGFNGSLSGIENARFIARIYGEDTDRVRAFVEDFSELGPALTMPFATYSSGMRARLAFAASMAIQFDWYLVDELTEVGDTSFRRKCAEAFRSRLREARIIMVSHGLSSLRNFCDMGIVLDGGEAHVFDDLEDAISYHEARMQEGQPMAVVS